MNQNQHENQGQTEQKIGIPGLSGQLEACFQPAPLSEPGQYAGKTKIGVICHPHPLHHGTMQNKVVTTITKAWQQMGLATLRFNFRGVGLSEGKYAEGIGEQDDLRSVLDWLRKEYADASLWLGGFSFGAFISSTVASLNEYPISALLSVAPPLRHFAFTKNLPEAPWIIIQGEKDELIPYPDVLNWYRTLEQKKHNVHLVSFKETSHFFHGKLIELKEAIQHHMKPYL